MSPLVTTAWLADNLAAPGLRIFDASFYLPTEAADARALFTAAHIPAARFFDLDEVADPETDLPHMVPSAGRFARLMSQYGVSNDSRVIFYDQKGIFSAARAWWLMGLFGHDDAAVLDGGLPAWQSENRPTRSGTPAAAPPAHFTASLRAARLRGLGDIRQNLDTNVELILDARPNPRFTGAAHEPRPNLPSGHIPGATSLPASDLLERGHMLPPDALRARFQQAGVDGTRPITTTCGTGVTAAILTLGLRVAGLAEGALYDGAWTEWASRPDTPKVTGA